MSSVVLNDVLCFIRNKYIQTSVKQLKAALMDFRDVEVLVAVKNNLLRDSEHLRNMVKFTHVPQRQFFTVLMNRKCSINYRDTCLMGLTIFPGRTHMKEI